MQDLLQNKTAVITGGTSGIGREIAIKFANAGAKVAIFGTNEVRGQNVVAEIQEKNKGCSAFFCKVDVANTQDVERAVEQVQKKFERVDILVNNAGITRDQLLMKMSEKDWDDVLAINVKSCYNTARLVVRSMIKSRSGKIINMSSVVGLTGNAGQVNYAASKAAMIGFTKALAKELAAKQICVNCIAPGFIDTKMTGNLTEAQRESTLNQIPFKKMGTPEDVANAALFLACHLSDYITGQVVTVDGGLTI